MTPEVATSAILRLSGSMHSFVATSLDMLDHVWHSNTCQQCTSDSTVYSGKDNYKAAVQFLQSFPDALVASSDCVAGGGRTTVKHSPAQECYVKYTKLNEKHLPVT